MTFRLLLKSLLILCGTYALLMDITFGFLYLMNVVLLLWYLREKNDKHGYQLIIVLAFFFFYLLRPLILWGNEESFPFANTMGEINQASHYMALLELFCYILTAFLGIKLGTGNTILKKTLSRDILYSGKNLFLYVVLAGLFIEMMTSTSGRSDGNIVQYLKIIAPFNIANIILAVILITRWNNLPKLWRYSIITLLLFSSIASISGGSKGAALKLPILFLTILVLINKKHDIKFNLTQILSFIFICFFIIIAYLYAAIYRSISDFTPSLVSVAEYMFEADWNNFGFLILDQFSKRMNGYDGLLVARIISINNVNLNDFSFLKLLGHAIGGIIPGVTLGNQYSSGKLIAMHFQGLPEDMRHASALGLFGFLRMYSFYIGVLVNFLIFFTAGKILRIIRIYFSTSAKITLEAILLLQIVSWVNSGNIDTNIESFLRMVILYGIYSIIFLTIVKICTKNHVNKSAKTLSAIN